jgi:acetoin utilization deacetylase AcuC-like enzyme
MVPRRADVLFVSLHRDPRDYHPFFSGYAAERGTAQGEGFTFNYPLAVDTTDLAYLRTLHEALDRVCLYAPGALVVSLGLDGHEADPARGLALTDAAFTEMGRMVAGLGLPVVLVQEGGYNPDVVGGSLVSFLAGWQ